MKDIIFIGKSGSGKTTLCQRLHDLEIKYNKTQTVEVYDTSIDTPGEYLENRMLYSALNTISADAKMIGLVYDPTAHENYFAPNFSSMFMKEVVGIITKISLVDESAIEFARKRLMMTNVTKIFEIDTLEDIGVKELFEYIKK